jgi:hypothetical protein
VQTSARTRFLSPPPEFEERQHKDNVRPWKTMSVKHERRRAAAFTSKGRTVPRSIRGTAEYVRTGQNVFTTYYLDHDFVHDCFPRWSRGSALFLLVEGAGASHRVVVDFRQPRHRNGLPPAAHASGLQDTEVGGVFPDHLRHTSPRRRADCMGRHAPGSSSERRQGRRSALTSRRRIVGPYGLDHNGQGTAQ